MDIAEFLLQSIERQVRNIEKEYSAAIIVREVYTRTLIEGRKEKELDKLLKIVKEGDCIIFDSISRMSRNAKEGVEMYVNLYYKGIDLVFLKEPHINTSTYKKALENQVYLKGNKVDYILEGVNRYLMELAREQIKLAFEQSEKEVIDLRQRTKEGIETARLNGKQIGHSVGTIYETKKAINAKEIIRKHNQAFGGSLNDSETIKQAGVSRKTFYKYKKEIKE